MHAPIRTEFVTTDPEEGRAHVAQMYAGSRLKVCGSAEDFHLEQSRCDLGEVRLDVFENSMATEYTVDPLDQVLVVRMLDRTMDIETEGTHRRLGPGDVAVLVQPDLGYTAFLDGARMQLIGFDLAFLEALDGAEILRRLRYEKLTPEQARPWVRTLDFVTRTVADPVAGTSPLVLGAATRMLGAATLSAFDRAEHPLDASLAVADRTDATPATLRRAVAYLEANPDLDLGVTEVAAACHVSVRALQLAFRRHLDTTPMAYLRRVRLDRVHSELVAADPAGTVTVTEVAARWGVLGTGRFSAQYREEYGELPSETLRRR
ncbi:helix-turn-helix transcriptional regulator [Nocardioides pyridinolyticus]